MIDGINNNVQFDVQNQLAKPEPMTAAASAEVESTDTDMNDSSNSGGGYDGFQQESDQSSPDLTGEGMGLVLDISV